MNEGEPFHRMAERLRNGGWEPIETAPTEKSVLISDGDQIAIASIIGGKWFSLGLEFSGNIKYWMPLPEPPK